MRPDALQDEEVGQFVGITIEIMNVIVARVVGADAVAGFAAEQLVNRLAGHFAEQIPQRDVDRADRANFHGDLRLRLRAFECAFRSHARRLLRAQPANAPRGVPDLAPIVLLIQDREFGPILDREG